MPLILMGIFNRKTKKYMLQTAKKLPDTGSVIWTNISLHKIQPSLCSQNTEEEQHLKHMN